MIVSLSCASRFRRSEELRYHSAMLAAIIADEMGGSVCLHEGGGAGPITNGTLGNVQADYRMDTIAECHPGGRLPGQHQFRRRFPGGPLSLLLIKFTCPLELYAGIDLSSYKRWKFRPACKN